MQETEAYTSTFIDPKRLLLEQARDAEKRLHLLVELLAKRQGQLFSIRMPNEPIIIGIVADGPIYIDGLRRLYIPATKYTVPDQDTRDFIVTEGSLQMNSLTFLQMLQRSEAEERFLIGDLEVLFALPPESYDRLCALFLALGRDTSHPYLEAQRLKRDSGW